MAIGTYSDLETAVANWLMRDGDTGFTARVPDFITLAEAVIKRRVRRKTVRAPLTLNQESVSLPADCSELRSVRLNTGVPYADGPIKIVTLEQLSDHRTAMITGGYYPRYASVINGQLVLVPAPTSALAAEITYYQAITPLSASSATNTVLTEAPDIYLYGACLEATPYLDRDDRIETWKTRFDQAVDELNIKREREEYGASVRPMRLARPFN